MSTPDLVYVLTALAALVVVLTWLRLGAGRGAARLHLGRRLVVVHTVCGVLATVAWTTFLVASSSTWLGSATAGIIALALWWVVGVAGLGLVARWLPARGKHAHAVRRDRWPLGPALSVIGHVAVVVAVVEFTYAYLTAAV